jgi:predicted neutral ceramidase superfamily lipid hydrolase
MVSIPLIYFVTQFQPIFYGLFSTLILWEPLLFALILTLIFAWSKTIGGILFYTAFRLSARKFPRNSLLRENLTISAIGMLMIFASNQAVVLVSAPYPPFGVLTVSLVGLSSYFLYLGVYSSAATIAQDEELRRFIKKAAERNVDLLQSMGSAHAEQEILQKIVLVTKTHRSSLEDKTGIGLQPDENEIRDYLEEVIKELKRNK